MERASLGKRAGPFHTANDGSWCIANSDITLNVIVSKRNVSCIAVRIFWQKAISGTSEQILANHLSVAVLRLGLTKKTLPVSRPILRMPGTGQYWTFFKYRPVPFYNRFSVCLRSTCTKRNLNPGPVR